MKQAEPVLSPAESLQLITGVIAQTKSVNRPWHYVFFLWGWLILAASLLFFLLKEFTGFALYFLPFPVLVSTGIILTIRHYRKQETNSESYADHFLQQLWVVLGIAFIVVVMVSVLQRIPPFTYTMVIGGIGTLLTGKLIRFTPMLAGGCFFLAMAVLSVFIPDAYKPLLQAAAVSIGYLLPAYGMMKQKH